ncbi:hypothetical protein CHCC14809_4047 [Bacillus licheniformis]|nr:hypothetical protein N399_13485 [Bacillus licheniformis CG-B52]KYC72219.1 hypothetical protein B4092_2753 [Bacillus licheniformis]TWN16305.1 hypothetical protein CHCC14564_0870 [Bacillus licheniformis LMG 17339]TWJ37708.1 hypothetical protein CHCC5026_2420 [Bacillus licheniformis]TWK56945.1 hypothetical protein CHCC20344_2963 [Bacillus licheniformis]
MRSSYKREGLLSYGRSFFMPENRLNGRGERGLDGKGLRLEI